MSYTGNVKRYLSDRAHEIRELVEEIIELEDDRATGHREQEYIQKVINPKISGKRFEIARIKSIIMSEIANMGNAEKQRISQLDRIKGEDLTDDYKLFGCGIKLTERDIESIIDRNSDNPTMIQLALRYANENGVQVNRVYTGHAADLQNVDNIYSAVKLYVDHWIDDADRAGMMLDKFFEGVE